MAQNRGAEPKYKVAVERNLAMRTRDGITLRADNFKNNPNQPEPRQDEPTLEHRFST